MEQKKILSPQLLVAILSVSLLVLCGLLTETATNIAFPTLMEEYNVTASSVQWLTTGKMLVVAMITPVSAYLKKRFLTRRLFVFSGMTFLVGCLIGTLAWNFSVLVLAALIQGVGVGIALPMVFNIILEQVPASQTGTMMGVASLIMAAGPALGPTFGGVVVTTLGWRAIFALMIPLTVLSLVGGGFTIRQKDKPEKTHLDVLGTVLVMLGFFLLVYGVSCLDSFSQKAIQVVVCLLAGVVVLALFCLHAKKTEKPLVRLDAFESPVFGWHLLSYILMQIVFLGFSFVLSNYLQVVCGAGAFATGLCLLPGALAQAILSVCSGMILDRCGAKKPIYFGSVLAVVGAALFVLGGLYLAPAAVVAFYILMELGLGCTYGNTMTHALQNIPSACHSDGNAIYNTFGQLAGSVGTSVAAVMLTVFQENPAFETQTEATSAGAHWVFVVFFVLLVLNFVFQVAAFRKAAEK